MNENTEQERKFGKVIIHPGRFYDVPRVTENDDIALIQLDRKVTLSTRIATISPANIDPEVGSFGTLAGWGYTQAFDFENPEAVKASRILRKTELPIVSNDTCNAAKKTLPILDGMICTGYEQEQTGGCTGDSGGPFVVGSRLIGINSFGRDCKTYTVFTRVSHYFDWIQSNSTEEAPSS